MFFDETAHVLRSFTLDLPPVDSGSATADLAASPDDSTCAGLRRLELQLWGWPKAGGDVVWRAAHLAAAELLRRGSTGVGGQQGLSGAQVLELGAGSGLLGTVAAHLGARAVVTDGDEAEVPALHANASLFVEAGGSRLVPGGSLDVAVLAWGNEAAAEAATESTGLLPQRGFDLIIGSDIVYMPTCIPALAETIDFFLADGGQALIANTAVATNTTQPEAKALFLKSLDALGLLVQVQTPNDHTGIFHESRSWSNTDYYLTITRAT